jgi:hypothetical protein
MDDTKIVYLNKNEANGNYRHLLLTYIWQKEETSMKNVIYTIVGMILVSIAFGCAPAQSPVAKGDVPISIVDNDSVSKLAGKPDRVELVYFHTKNPCHCMAVVKENLTYAVDTYFKNEVASGKVKLITIVSDDPANATLVTKYDAMLFTLFIKEIRGSQENIYPVSDIWNLTGDDNRDKLINFIRLKVNNVLEGKGS